MFYKKKMAKISENVFFNLCRKVFRFPIFNILLAYMFMTTLIIIIIML